MNRFTLKTLVVNDDDLKCETGKIPLLALNLGHLNFVEKDLEGYDLIVYQGTKGCKILKNRAFRSGKVG